jgi:hypothetical protein
MTGKRLLIDLRRAQADGGRVYTVPELVADLRRFIQANPAASARVEKLIWAVEKIEGEVLIKGSVPGTAVGPLSAAHKAYVKSAEDIWTQFAQHHVTQSELESALSALEKAYRRARIIGRVGRVVMVIGLVLTVKDVAQAIDRSIDHRSFKPVATEVFRQVMGWDGALAGMRLGGLLGAAFGIETGPGAVLFSAAGAIVFGAVGYFGADLVAQAAWGDE